MFSDNQKISGRQSGRFFTLCSLGTAGLTVPRILAGESGKTGIYSIVLGILFLFVYLFFTGKIYEKTRTLSKEKYPFYFATEKVVKIAYLAVFAVGGSFLLVQQSALVQDMLLPKVPVWILSGVFLLLCGYGALNGIEDLARIGEVLFYLIMLLLVILFLVTIGNVPVPETFSEGFLQGFLEGNTGNGTGNAFTQYLFTILKGAVKILPFGLSFLLMSLHYDDFVHFKKGSLGVVRALFFFGGFLVVLYFFCIGVFGVELMKNQSWSLVELMNGVNLPGGLFGKVDAFFSMVFILGLFFLVSQILILWSHSLRKITGCKKGKWFLLTGMIVIYVGSLILGNYYDAEKFYMKFMERFGLWLIAIWPLLQGLWIAFRGKRGTVKALVIILALLPCSVALTGCSASLEEREYVLAIGIDKGDEGYKVTYSFPDLSKVSDQGGSMENRTSYVAQVTYLKEAEADYLSKADKEPDYNHLKAIVIEKALVESEDFWRQFLDLCLDGTYSRDMTIFLCEGKAGEILEAAAKENGSAGIFLEELCRNAQILKDKKILTVGDLCFFASENTREMVRAKAENLVVPMLAVEEERPTISQTLKYN